MPALVCTSSRQFADAVQYYLPFWLLCMLAVECFEWASSGNGFEAWYASPFHISAVFLLAFRRRYFLVGLMAIFFSEVAIKMPAICATSISGSTRFPFEYDTYGECVLRGYDHMVLFLVSLGGFLTFLLGRKLKVFVSGRHAARTSSESHRHAPILALPQPIWAHLFGDLGFFSAPKLTDSCRTPSLST